MVHFIIKDQVLVHLIGNRHGIVLVAQIGDELELVWHQGATEESVRVGPLTVSKTTWALARQVGSAAMTVVIALIALRLVPVLERLVDAATGQLGLDPARGEAIQQACRTIVESLDTPGWLEALLETSSEPLASGADVVGSLAPRESLLQPANQVESSSVLVIETAVYRRVIIIFS